MTIYNSPQHSEKNYPNGYILCQWIHNANLSFIREPYESICCMFQITSSMDTYFFLSFMTVFAKLSAFLSHSARLAASIIDSKSSTCATPTILLPKEKSFSKMFNETK